MTGSSIRSSGDGEPAAAVEMGQPQGQHRDQSSCLASVLTGNYRALCRMEMAAKRRR